MSDAPGEPRPVTPPTPVPATGFTEDWFAYNVPVWARVLAPLVGKPVRALEIGVFEGRSTVWLLENVLTHPDVSLTWTDTFGGRGRARGRGPERAGGPVPREHNPVWG
ncbi:class I SAM-dependent methyltransferase [Gemmata massiliana]|uniref:class I SAM-dependent methyltransferase n=1 Tax=Gemmata massiliana TaxID=1210884 RepID=UPI0013A6FD71|nr:class I SAM-dependent methyltransferase [Gemmata massiliana]